MSRRLKNHLPELQVLNKCNSKQRKALLEYANKDLILCLSECCANCLKGNVQLTKSQKKALSRHKKELRFVGNKRNDYKARKSMLVQRGGFLTSLLGPILSMLLK